MQLPSLKKKSCTTPKSAHQSAATEVLRLQIKVLLSDAHKSECRRSGQVGLDSKVNLPVHEVEQIHSTSLAEQVYVRPKCSLLKFAHDTMHTSSKVTHQEGKSSSPWMPIQVDQKSTSHQPSARSRCTACSKTDLKSSSCVVTHLKTKYHKVGNTMSKVFSSLMMIK